MDKKTLQNTFREYKRATSVAGRKVDYAITNPDGLGDCMSCVNDALCDKYGVESKGVWVKEWTRGMNGGEGIENLDHVYIAHDPDNEQVALFYQTVGEHYNILPKQEDFSPAHCFILYEKDTPVYTVTYKEMWRGREWARSDEFTDKENALSHLDRLFINAMYRNEDEPIWDIALKRVF
jgi:hypothetical protein